MFRLIAEHANASRFTADMLGLDIINDSGSQLFTFTEFTVSLLGWWWCAVLLKRHSRVVGRLSVRCFIEARLWVQQETANSRQSEPKGEVPHL